MRTVYVEIMTNRARKGLGVDGLRFIPIAAGTEGLGESRAAPNGFAGFLQLVDADVMMDDGFLGETATAEIADDFADNACVAAGNETGLRRF